MEITDFLLTCLKYLAYPANDTILLFALTILDTVLAMGWRIKQDHPLLSGNFKAGLLVNSVLSLLPYAMGILNDHTPHDEPLNILIPIFALGITIMMTQSIMANAVLYGVKIPTWAQGFYDKFLSAEVEKKRIKVAKQEDEFEEIKHN